MSSLLQLINAADNLPLQDTAYPTRSPDGTEQYVPFQLTFADFKAGIPPIGLLRPCVIHELQIAVEARGDSFLIFRSDDNPASDVIVGGPKTRNSISCIFFADWAIMNGEEDMGRLLQEVVWKWKEDGKFSSQLGEWYDEVSQVHASPLSSLFSGRDVTQPFANKVFSVVRVACPIFGFVTYGSYLTIYEMEGEEMKIWVAKRSQSNTYSGMLDITVAGGVQAGSTPFDTIVREAEEEASLPASLIRSYAKPAGFISIIPLTSSGWLQPQMGFVHDLCLPHSTSVEYVVPTPNDDEVESLSLLSIKDVLAKLHAGNFKPNCGIVTIDFLIRKGIITVEMEPELRLIRKRLVRSLGIAGPNMT